MYIYIYIYIYIYYISTFLPFSMYHYHFFIYVHICTSIFFNTCDICKNLWSLAVYLFVLLLVRNITSGNFTCHSSYVIYQVECIKSKCQYVGSATSFKQHFLIHKSDIKTKKDGCRTVRHFNSICCHPINPHHYLNMQLIQQVFCDASKEIESILWELEE